MSVPLKYDFKTKHWIQQQILHINLLIVDCHLYLFHHINLHYILILGHVSFCSIDSHLNTNTIQINIALFQ